MIFYLYTSVLIAGLCLLAFVLVRWTGASDHTSDDSNLAFYKTQLTDLDQDFAKGRIDDADYKTLRAEAARRLLSEHNRMRSASAVSGKALISLCLVMCVVAAFVGYTNVGSVGYKDQPLVKRYAAAERIRNERMSQATASADFVPTPQGDTTDLEQLANRLRAALIDRPNDPQGLEHLVRVENALGNYPAGAQAQWALIKAKSDTATVTDWAFHAELLIAAADGYISPQAEASLRAALQLDPSMGLPRFRLGQVYLATGRPDLTFNIWQDLLAQGPEAAHYIPAIRSQIDQIAIIAGHPRYQQPAPQGPTAQEIRDAQMLDTDDQQAMIQDMVSRLADRLGTQGGTADEWARLITALGVLNKHPAAKDIYNEATSTFANNADALAILKAAAQTAGISQ